MSKQRKERRQQPVWPTPSRPASEAPPVRFGSPLSQLRMLRPITIGAKLTGQAGQTVVVGKKS